MGELNLEMVVKRRPEPQRSVPDKFSKMQSTSSLQSAGLTNPAHNSQAFQLSILQIPKDCRIAGKLDNDKPTRASKWPLDPAPVVEFKLHDGDSSRSYLHSPFWFCSAALEHAPGSHGSMDMVSSALAGCLVSSLHKVKLQDNIGEHGLFIFGDLHAKITGTYRLRFTLYELRSNADSTYVATLASKLSEPFTIHSGKTWPGQAESTTLSRHLCDSGVKLRIRKETSKRKMQTQDWSSDRQSAISTLSLPHPMGPPPKLRRRLTGEPITPDQVKFAGGLGIKGAMDREQYTNGQRQLSASYAGVGDYRAQPDAYPNLSNSYPTQSSSAYQNRSSGLYNPTSYASTQYLTGQVGYNSDATLYTPGIGLPSTLYPPRTASIQDQPYSASPGSGYNVATSRYGGSYTDNTSRIDMDRYNPTNTFGALPSIYGTRSEYTEPVRRYDEGRTERPILPSESTGTTNSHMLSWPPPSLSTIDPPRTH